MHLHFDLEYKKSRISQLLKDADDHVAWGLCVPRSEKDLTLPYRWQIRMLAASEGL